MVSQEAPEFISSQRRTKCIASQEVIPPERNSESRWGAPTHGIIEKMPTSKPVGKAKIPSHHIPHPTPTQDIQLGGYPKLPASPWGEGGVHCTPNSLPFQTPAGEMASLNLLALTASGAFNHKSHGTIANKVAVNMGHLLRVQSRERGRNAHLLVFPWKGFDASFASCNWEFSF